MAYSGEQTPKPEYLGRKGEGLMDDEEFHTVVRDALAQSAQFIDSELSVERARATEYYLGKPFGNEEEGRSQAILTEVRDACDGILPSLLRIMHGPEHAVEFVPSNAKTVEMAAQATDYVRHVYEEANDGFFVTHACAKDGLVRKLGVIRWGWDTSSETKSHKIEGVSEDGLKILAADDSVSLVKKGTFKRKDGLYDVQLTQTAKGGCAWVKAVPPEEFLYNRNARSIDEAMIVAHRTEKTRGELIAMGVKEADLDAHGQAGESDPAIRGNAEEIARRDIASVGRSSGQGFSNDPEMGKANDKIVYTEAYMTIDFDGDGIAELRRICTIGHDYYPVENDPADDRPFATFSPYPEPHVLLGGSVADRTMDVQKINSALLRGMLDSLSASIFPRTAYLEGQANVADIMNTAIGAPMRERVAGAIRTLEMPFVGKEALPIMSFMQDVIERRTGRNKGAAGLDADALQSTGKEAVGAVLSGSQEQIELIARVLAQTLKRVFKGLGKLLQQHAPASTMVRLRGQWVDVDPRTWDADLDVTVNVALGTSFTDKKVATLMAVASDQENLIQQLGMSNPATSLPKFLHTRAKILSLQGIKDFESYYNALPPDWQPPQPAAPQPTDEEKWIQAEKEMNHTKTMKELAIKQDELNLKREQAQWDHDFAIQKLAADTAMKKYIADATNHTATTSAALETHIQEQATETELAMQAHDQLHDQQLEMSQHEHDKEMAVRAADTADAQAAQATGPE